MIKEAPLSTSSKTVIQKYWNAFALGSVYDWWPSRLALCAILGNAWQPEV